MTHERGSGSALITIAIVSRNQLLRLGLQAVIAPHEHLRLIGEAANTLQAMSLVSQEKPHLLIIELEPGMDILGLVRKVKASLSTIRIIALHGIEDSRGGLDALSSGIDGMVLTTQPGVVLLAVIEYLCRRPAIAARCLPCDTSAWERSGSTSGLEDPMPIPPDWSEDLTKREHDIIALIGEGLSNKDIACRLNICSTTVRHHLTSIFGKLDVHSRQQLLIRAHKYGLVKLHANGTTTRAHVVGVRSSPSESVGTLPPSAAT
ncbi:MAG: response regulator transcription factor [Nitrospira sp.]|nr:response regulator transcription factor [Nitrospira sp.]